MAAATGDRALRIAYLPGAMPASALQAHPALPSASSARQSSENRPAVAGRCSRSPARQLASVAGPPAGRVAGRNRSAAIGPISSGRPGQAG